MSFAVIACATHGAGRRTPTPGKWEGTFPGRALAAWLNAYNTGNLDSLSSFAARAFDSSALARRSARERADSDHWLFVNLGPMRVARIEAITDTAITASVWQTLVEGWGHVTVAVTASDHKLKSRNITFFEPPPGGAAHEGGGNSDFDLAETARLDTYVQKLVNADVFSGVVLVSSSGRVIVEKAYGLAHRSPDVRSETAGRYQLASVSKMFTAVAVAQLVEQGKLSFSDTLARLLPDFPNAETGRRVTVAQLLNHTSGIPDYFTIPRYWETRTQLRDLRDYWQIFAQEPLRFAPGEHYEYSSSGYILLGAIIERVTGQSFREYIREHVFQPAGMTSTSYAEGKTLPQRATPYTKAFGPGEKPDPNHWHEADVADSAIGMSAGGGTSTAADMGRFMDALLQHRLLTAAMTDSVFLQRVLDPEEGGRSYGFESNTWNGFRIIGHNGFAPGAFNQVEMFPDLGYVTVVLSNEDTSGGGAVSYWLRIRLSGLR